MPELPEVEAVCRKLREEVAGKRIVSAHVARPGIVSPQEPAEFVKCVSGRSIEAIERRGKNIVVLLSGGWAIRVHLRMTGNLYAVPDVRFLPVAARVHFELAGHAGLVYADPRGLGRMRAHAVGELDELLQEVGMEPLSNAFTPEWLLSQAKKSRQPSKVFLMDQTHIAGLGNIYAAEALFRSKIHPQRVISRISRQSIAALHHSIVEVLKDAVQSACNAYSGPGRFGEAESFSCFVYGRPGQPCKVCRRVIRRIAQGGRSTYYCPGCQK